MNDAELQASYQAAVAARRPATRADCPSPEDLQDLAERQGPEDKRLATLDHAMACESCHRELALLQAIHAARPRQVTLMSRPWLAAAGLLVVLAGGVLLSRGVARPVADDVTRGVSNSPGTEGVVLVAPVGPVAPGQLHTLIWRAVPGTVRYSVEILDTDGRVLYATRTADTSIVLPPVAGSPAVWWVRATLSDGTERRSHMGRLGNP